MSEEKSEEVCCIWNLGTECGGDTAKVMMFGKQLEIPICEKHLDEHKELMVLYANDYPIEEVLDMDPEERKRIYCTLVLSGVELKSPEI